MPELTTKTVKVPEDKAEEWDEYVEQNPVADSISHLIRLSVQRQMDGRYNEPQTVSGDTEAAPSGEVLDTLRDIQTAISGLDDRLTAIERTEKEEASYDLEKALYTVLPEEKESFQYDQWAITSEELAQKLGADEDAVQDTLERLEENTGQFRSVSGGPEGKTYWFKETN